MVTYKHSRALLRIDSYGFIYYAKQAPSGCTPVALFGDLSKDEKTNASRRFVIGPTVESGFHKHERASMGID